MKLIGGKITAYITPKRGLQVIKIVAGKIKSSITRYPSTGTIHITRTFRKK